MVRDFIFQGIDEPFFLWPEDNSSFMGGSDVVHCVRVPLTGTTVAEFWACGSLVGVGLCTFSHSVYNIVDIADPSIIVV